MLPFSRETIHRMLSPASGPIAGAATTTHSPPEATATQLAALGDVSPCRKPAKTQIVNATLGPRVARSESPQYCRVPERNLRHA